MARPGRIFGLPIVDAEPVTRRPLAFAPMASARPWASALVETVGSPNVSTRTPLLPCQLPLTAAFVLGS